MGLGGSKEECVCKCEEEVAACRAEYEGCVKPEPAEKVEDAEEADEAEKADEPTKEK